MEPDLKKQGYDKEEEYFFKLNKSLIEKIRKKKEAEQAERENIDSEE